MEADLLGARTALVIVDVQNCFAPGGALAVPGGDEIVGPLNAYIEAVTGRDGIVVASLDWHPPDHSSFREQGGPWPVHAVAGTDGADFHPGLRLPPTAHVVRKGTVREREAYSAFDGTDLEETLRRQGIERLLVGGLATDYCVRHTVLDALRAGFEVWLLLDAVRAVNASPGDGERAIEEMRAAGARVLASSSELRARGHCS